MYGAFWCSHCYGQKQVRLASFFLVCSPLAACKLSAGDARRRTCVQELGFEATDQYLTYVECDKKGANSKRDFCKEKKVPGFPTWEINGELFPGEKSLEDLAKISGFKGTIKK